MGDYHRIADAVAAEIAAGRLRPGDRLPPQRRFARRHGIATSTAARVYGELVRRGLAVGEVGRGTFVRAAAPPPEPALAEPGGARADLELNFAVLPEQPALQARSLDRLLRTDVLAAALPPVGVAGTVAAREAAVVALGHPGWQAEPRRVLFTGNGRQAVAAAVAALVPAGERLGVEALTYPVVKGIAARLGVTLVPIATDADGLEPDAVAAAHRAAPLRAVYCQPTLHNPLGTTMSADRRAALAEVLRAIDVPAVEDVIYAFLRDAPPPLAAFAPERTVLVDSLSKRLAPGLTLGFVVAPDDLVDRVAAAVRSGGWAAQRFALDAATCWVTDGTLATVEAAKRRDAAARQELARGRLRGFTVHADPAAYHLWWELPERWRAETFVASAARRGIAISPGAAFAVGAGRAPAGVRLALSAPPVDTLAAALDVLAAIARGGPDDDPVD
ncbi:aminotransferase-like domain-containing protein [Pseudonocardia bannensis]|uniref:PLP-dependent aminotransferase family protein n=1 Tax=Pseudonocardia bannensis TaxID=630973 RepID=A0A848DGZ9_9PSEU|nr:PLP-dependent aminotransferase family protein [Pseudonocardia bannensis]NMH91950.1 PLP-dependent aminotransferase family protein [Pseudonocardia bannensis]